MRSGKASEEDGVVWDAGVKRSSGSEVVVSPPVRRGRGRGGRYGGRQSGGGGRREGAGAKVDLFLLKV